MAEDMTLTDERRQELEAQAHEQAKQDGCTCDPVVTVTEGSDFGTLSTVVECQKDTCTRG